MERLIAKFLFFLLTAFFAFSCNSVVNKEKSDNLQSAKGAPGEVILVMDSLLWEGELGVELRETFKSSIPSLPRDEPYFKVSYVQPQKFNSVLQSAKNIIFVTVMDESSAANRKLKGYFTKESLEMIDNDPSLYMLAKKDDFARGQDILHLFGQNQETLIENIVENREKLRQYFTDAENKRLHKSLFASKQRSGITSLIQSEYNCSIQVPAGYEIAIQDTSFIWLRHFSREVDRNVFIYYTDYTSLDQFKQENIVDLRHEITKKYIYGDPDNLRSFVVTEEESFPLFSREINFNGKYTVELRGLWKTNNISMGGPFTSYTLVDEDTQRLYYVEGFLYSPGKDQREFMRELEVIMNTFKTSSEIKS
ncbi:MAG: DUF4837 family protein [Cyclobacteriaceae bacterium]